MLLFVLLVMLLFVLLVMPAPVTPIFVPPKRPPERHADERCQMRPNHNVHIGDEPSAATTHAARQTMNRSITFRVTRPTAGSSASPNTQSVLPMVTTSPPDAPNGRLTTITALP